MNLEQENHRLREIINQSDRCAVIFIGLLAVSVALNIVQAVW